MEKGFPLPISSRSIQGIPKLENVESPKLSPRDNSGPNSPRGQDSNAILYVQQVFKTFDIQRERENANPAFEIFYDPLQKRLIYLRFVHLYIFQPYAPNKDNNPLYFQLPSKLYIHIYIYIHIYNIYIVTM